METWQIVLIVIAVLVVIGLIIGLSIYFVKKNKKSNSTDTVEDNVESKDESTTDKEDKDPTPDPEPTPEPEQPEIEVVPEVIQLTAVKLLKGSSVVGYETNEELKKRLSTLTKDEFLALNIDEKPYTLEQWDALAGDEKAIQERNAYEMSIYFAYDYEGNLKSDADIIKREFLELNVGDTIKVNVK